jgi:hypothetical protein
MMGSRCAWLSEGSAWGRAGRSGDPGIGGHVLGAQRDDLGARLVIDVIG